MSIQLEPANPINEELSKVAHESYLAGLSALRVGTTFLEVVEAMKRPVTGAGCWTLTPLIHSQAPLVLVGGMGIDIQKSPVAPLLEGKMLEVPQKLRDAEIKPGMVFELEPNAGKGKNRVNIGGTVIINEKGAAEELNKITLRMNVKD